MSARLYHVAVSIPDAPAGHVSRIYELLRRRLGGAVNRTSTGVLVLALMAPDVLTAAETASSYVSAALRVCGLHDFYAQVGRVESDEDLVLRLSQE